MRVVHVSTYDLRGGAARAAYRYHEAINRAGVDSYMLVGVKESIDDKVVSSSGFISRGLGRLRSKCCSIPSKIFKASEMFSSGVVPSSGLVCKLDQLEPDIVHLHWVNNGVISLSELKDIKQPVVLSLHDMWAFTGGCHYTGDCIGFRDSCNSCPIVNTMFGFEIAKYLNEYKQAVFSHLGKLVVLGVGSWVATQAKSSSILSGVDVRVVPNTIDVTKFYPEQRDFARTTNGFSKNKKLLLFGAVGGSSNVRKGFKQLVEVLVRLPDYYQLVVFGSSGDESYEVAQMVHYLPHISDDSNLRMLYSAADVMLVPSLQETFGQTALEAMACGTPVVAFAATGPVDIVGHKLSGYLAAPYSVSDFYEGVEWVLAQDPALLSKNAVERVRSLFSYDVVGNNIIDVYSSLLSD